MSSRRTSLRAGECDGQLYFRLQKPECGGLDSKGSLVAPVSKEALINRMQVGVSKMPVLMRFGSAGFETNGP